ncbi:MAG: ParB N-terminal domain-containing protein [Candidatus Bathyarchaeia archaeon]
MRRKLRPSLEQPALSGSVVMVGYSVRHRSLTLEIAIAEASSLLPHEEVMPAEVSRLSKRIRDEGALHHPILADKGSYTVLDGMHRLEAVKRLGCRRILVCLMDYFNPTITVRVWYRCFKDVLPAALMKALETERGLKHTNRSLEEIRTSLGSSTIDLAVLAEKYYVLHSGRSLEYAIDLVKRVEKEAESPITYETEEEAIRGFREGRASAVLCLRPILKEEIVSFAKVGRLLPCKTTRHLVPARPIGIDVPLETLSDEKTPLASVNEELARSLERRKALILPPGTVVNGRRYEEELLSFHV